MNRVKKRVTVDSSLAQTLFYLVLIVSLASCSSSNSFQSFYNEHKSEADWALAFPKYMALIAIPGEAKDDIRRFSKGMRKIRVLLNEPSSRGVEKGVYDEQLITSFKTFAEGKNYTPYIVVKKDGSNINLFAREEGEYIREIVLDVKSDDGAVIIGLIGKMEKRNFQRALSEITI